MSQPTPTAASPPTIVLVHGAFADASNRNGVIEGSHVIMISQLQVVTDVILPALAATLPAQAMLRSRP